MGWFNGINCGILTAPASISRWYLHRNACILKIVPYPIYNFPCPLLLLHFLKLLRVHTFDTDVFRKHVGWIENCGRN